MGGLLEKIAMSADDNLETFTLVWLDASVNTTDENRDAQNLLKKTIHQLKAFQDPPQCEKYILSLPVEDRVVLIVSGQLGREHLPKYHSYQQLLSVYVYCYNQELNEQWAVTYPKIKAVVTNLNELIARIQFDHEKRQESRIYESLPISIFDPQIPHEKLTANLQGQLVHSQLLINCLLRMDSDKNDKQNLIALSKTVYRKNRTELKAIDAFERDYEPQRAIFWYTKNSFVSRLLNKALRIQNIDILFVFQFFIVDIRRQLEKSQCKARVTVYRGQLMSKNEVQKLKSSLHQFISINSFLSATKNSQTAISYLQNADGLEKVLFEINADPAFSGDKPFANIQSFSADQEEETLFMLGSIFEIVDVSVVNNEIWKVRLKLFSDNNEQINSNQMQNQSHTQLLAFGHVLITMGNVQEAQIYYDRLLKILPSNDPDRARCLEALASLADEKKEYQKSLEIYEEVLKINKHTYGEQSSYTASNYNSIGEAYRKKGDYDKALRCYEDALKILEPYTQGKELLQKAISLNSIGIIHQEKKQYIEALKYYAKAHEIRLHYKPRDETSLGMSLNNIGNAQYLLTRYDDALYYYQEALKIYKTTLPPNHPKVASVYNNIGAIYDDKKKINEALAFYMDAYKIYANIYSDTHPNLIKIKENIDRLQSQAKR
ncbi:unnamed protein product [Rotaria socialis]|uniref:Uncharacterized protein n=1 Tax=Rotaria socialis TaxID=392032 RepID=A0A818I274_9BILA|nr:unnamed protein product [Rotaria socialis]CAF3385143.1 unnamed protein product [Rotaria socialis]CAF3512371.1 unnamed protein product [Rotaria socialis]CAF4292368.1 unnamed protein product [Rotaria socialis]CAF4631660.1 unnamed protein product [Rotaria socialis]